MPRGRNGRRQALPRSKFFAEGRCTKGDECTFSHDFIPPPVEASSRSAQLLVDAVQDIGGTLSTGRIGAVYAIHPELRDAVQSAGGLKEFCSRIPDLVLDEGKITCTTNTNNTTELVECICAMEYPGQVAAIIARLELVLGRIRGASVRAFGSSVTGFGDHGSDIDLVLVASVAQLALDLDMNTRFDVAKKALTKVAGLLEDSGICVQEALLSAKVPIVKFVCEGVECDLSLNNMLPMFNTRLLKAYAEMDPRSIELVQSVKKWAKKHNVHGAADCNLSSYAFTLMAVFYMQIREELPCLQRSCEPKWYYEAGKKYNVAMHLQPQAQQAVNKISVQDFTNFYCKTFAWGTSVVSVRTGCLQSLSAFPNLKTTVELRTIHIEDPFDLERDIASVLNSGSSKKLWQALAQAERADGVLMAPSPCK